MWAPGGAEERQAVLDTWRGRAGRSAEPEPEPNRAREPADNRWEGGRQYCEQRTAQSAHAHACESLYEDSTQEGTNDDAVLEIALHVTVLNYRNLGLTFCRKILAHGIRNQASHGVKLYGLPAGPHMCLA